MPPPPPLKDVLNALEQCVLPGAGGAALVMCAFLLFGRWSAATAAAVAVALAFMWGNYAFEPTAEAPKPTWENTSRLLHWKPAADAPGYQLLPRAALVLLAVGLVSRWLGLGLSRVLPERAWWGAGLVVWLARAGAVAAVSSWLVLGKAAEAPQWANLCWELAAAMLATWFVLDELARTGISAEISAYLGAALFAAGIVLLYTHNARFMELAVILGSAMFGIAVATALVKADPNADEEPEEFNPNPNLYDTRKPVAAKDAKLSASGALPAAVMFLAGLVLGTRPSHAENKVPAECFWLVALAPLVLLPFLIPWVARQNRWLLLALRAALVLAPLVVAVVLAGQHEKFPYEEEPQW